MSQLTISMCNSYSECVANGLQINVIAKPLQVGLVNPTFNRIIMYINTVTQDDFCTNLFYYDLNESYILGFLKQTSYWQLYHNQSYKHNWADLTNSLSN